MSVTARDSGARLRERHKRTTALLDAAEQAQRWTAVSQLSRMLLTIERDLDTLEEREWLAADRAQDGGDNEGAQSAEDLLDEFAGIVESLPDSVLLEAFERAGKGYLLADVSTTGGQRSEKPQGV